MVIMVVIQRRGHDFDFSSQTIPFSNISHYNDYLMAANGFLDEKKKTKKSNSIVEKPQQSRNYIAYTINL